MPWIQDTDGRIINLDTVDTLFLVGTTVFARILKEGVDTPIFTGANEEEAEAFYNRLKSSLPGFIPFHSRSK